MKTIHGHGTGFTLLELSIALLATSVLALGTISFSQAVATSSRLQQSLAGLDENARFAAQSIGTEISHAGYRPRPWLQSPLNSFQGSTNSATAAGDRLVIRRWSDTNCFENPNPRQDGHGRPAFYLRVSAFEVRASGQLAITCHYGPDEVSLVRQLNRLGLVESVLGFHAQFAVDENTDGVPDYWAADLPEADGGLVLAVRVGLVLQSRGRYRGQSGSTLRLLDEIDIPVPADHLYSTIEVSWPVMGNLQS